MERSVELTVEAGPVPASRPRVTPRGTFYPKQHKEYEQFLGQVLKTKPHLTDPTQVVEVKFLFVMPPYKKSDYPTARADIDNLSKLPLDAMTKSVDPVTELPRYWADDNLVVILSGAKRFARPGEEPHTKIKIRQITGDHSDYVDRWFNDEGPKKGSRPR